MLGLILFACGEEEAAQPISLCLYVPGAWGGARSRDNRHAEFPGEQKHLALLENLPQFAAHA